MTTARAAAFTGTLLTPESPGYDDARRVWNGAIDRRPAFIARCRTADDVVAALALARRHDLAVAVRGGGHSIPGWSVCDGGLVVDLTPMKGIRIDPATRRAVVEPGVSWGEFDAAAQAHGLATPGGEISHTGVAGLTIPIVCRISWSIAKSRYPGNCVAEEANGLLSQGGAPLLKVPRR